jgi:hypothetical protein
VVLVTHSYIKYTVMNDNCQVKSIAVGGGGGIGSDGGLGAGGIIGLECCWVIVLLEKPESKNV